jgi:hypothetical protein
MRVSHFCLSHFCLSHFQTFILSISGVAFTGGFGTYLTGMSYQTYLNLNRWGRMGHNIMLRQHDAGVRGW